MIEERLLIRWSTLEDTLRILFATQYELLKLVIDPEVDEKVSDVIDVDQIEEVGRH